MTGFAPLLLMLLPLLTLSFFDAVDPLMVNRFRMLHARSGDEPLEPPNSYHRQRLRTQA